MSASIKGKYICVTGKLSDFTRAELSDLAKEYGFTLMKSVTKTTDILVVGDKPGASKLNNAHLYGTRQMSGDDFIFILGSDEALGLGAPKTVDTQEEVADQAAFYETQHDTGLF